MIFTKSIIWVSASLTDNVCAMVGVDDPIGSVAEGIDDLIACVAEIEGASECVSVGKGVTVTNALGVNV